MSNYNKQNGNYYKSGMQDGYNNQSQYNQPQNSQDQYNQDQYNQDQYNQDQYNQEQYNQEQEAQSTQRNINQEMIDQQNGDMIKNPNINIAQNKSQDMNDRDYLNDILATEKYLSAAYNTFLLEISHTELHTDVKQILSETHDCAREIFNLMFENGFYSFQSASP